MRILLPGVVTAVALLFVAVVSIMSEHHTVYTVHTELTEQGDVIRTPKLTSVTNLQRQQRLPGPQAFVESAVHDFGRMDPLTLREHAFVIRNTGDAPLELTEGPTTCKCTLASVPQRTIAPGEKTAVVVQWNSGRDLEYSHSATVYTNDPRRRAIHLTVKGQVAALFRCVPERLVFSRIVPGEAATSTVTVYSQVWDELELAPIEPELAGLTLTVDAADAAEIQRLEARSARQITVTLPADLPEGYTQTAVTLYGQPAGGSADQAADCELTIDAKVIRRLSVYGPEIDVRGTVDLGRVRQGQAAQVRLLLKLRDDERRLPVKQVDATPAFLQVRVEPYRSDSAKEQGLYYLFIEVPRDAPTFRLPPGQHGAVRIEFDHPRVEQLELPVDLIVVPRDGV